ncbi:MAG: hypothetical protein ACKVQQ_20970 [Burkholderiales bacterium]
MNEALALAALIAALALPAESLPRIYLGCKAWVDRAAGLVMGTLGVRPVVHAENATRPAADTSRWAQGPRYFKGAV